MSLFKRYKTDADRETSGVWISYGTTADGRTIEFKIARAGGQNKAYEKRFEALTRPYRRQIQTESLDDETSDRIVRQLFAETIVLGWRNVEDEEGKPIAFSAEACRKLFDELPDLFRDIREDATKQAIFRQDVLERDAGN